jgi:hypothetical protein
MKEKFKNLEIWFKIFLLFFFSILYFMAIPYPKASKQLPQLVAQFTLIILSISLLSDFLRKKKGPDERPEMGDAGLDVSIKEEATGNKKRFYQTWAIMLVATAVGYWIGFLFSSFLLFIGFAYILGPKKSLFKNTLIAILVTVVIYVLFGQIMGVPLVEK